MMAATNEGQAPTFEYEVLSELPGSGSPIYIPNEGGGVGRDGVIVKVRPANGEPWVGIFAFGDMLPGGECAVYPAPGKGHLTIVARGEAYVISADDPADYVRVKSCPAIRVIPVPSRGLVIFHDYTEIVAYNESGLVWETDRVSWDGIEIAKVTEGEIIGKSWDAPSESHVELRVDLTNGRHQGGSAPPEYPTS